MLTELRSNVIFDLQKTNELLPLIIKITSSYKTKVENNMLILEQTLTPESSAVVSIEAEIDQLIDTWKEKMRRLGAKPAGLWSLDFDNGDGYFCWKYPEAKINYQHGYKEGYTSRKPVTQSLLQFE